MTRLTDSLTRRRRLRATRRTEIAVRRAVAAAPTVESAHEIQSAAARS